MVNDLPLFERVLAPNPSPMTLSGTNTYLLGRGAVAVVDPGPDLAPHVEAVLEAAARRGRIALLLVTHSHPDHLPAARALRARTGALLLGHPSIDGVDRGLSDDQRLELDGLVLRALYTPGHTRDHYCFLVEGPGLLLTGDLVLGSGTVVLGPTHGSLGEYMASLERLLGVHRREHPFSRLLPGHGPLVDDPAGKLEEYLRHRRMREDQVLQALRRGLRRVEEIVPQLYADVDARLHASAARNVAAHLDKLEREGRVERRGESWYAV